MVWYGYVGHALGKKRGGAEEEEPTHFTDIFEGLACWRRALGRVREDSWVSKELVGLVWLLGCLVAWLLGCLVAWLLA